MTDLKFFLGKLKGSFSIFLFRFNCNVSWALQSFLHEMNFVFTQVFALQSVLKLFFLLVFFSSTLEMLQSCCIVIYFPFSGRLFA
jgi:hypothetical protein